MTLIQILLFAHVASAIALFAALAIEGVAQRGIERAATLEAAREWTAVWRILPAVGVPAVLGALASGIYLATVGHLWSTAWVQVAIPLLVVNAIAGAVGGVRRTSLQKELDSEARGADLRARLVHPVFQASWWARLVLIGALLFVMTTRPAGAIVYALTGAAVVGAIVLFAMARRPERSALTA